MALEEEDTIRARAKARRGRRHLRELREQQQQRDPEERARTRRRRAEQRGGIWQSRRRYLRTRKSGGRPHA